MSNRHAPQISIVPQPKSLAVHQSLAAWILPSKVDVFVTDDNAFAKQHFESIREPFQRLTGCELSLSKERSTSTIIAEINSDLSLEE